MKIMPYRVVRDPTVPDRYHDRPRPELVDIASRSGLRGRVLDVGCAAGALGEALLSSGRCSEVVGIEQDVEVARRAAGRLTHVIQGDLNDPMLCDSLVGSFDTIFFADVLEHLARPEVVLRHLVARLQAGGLCIISLPNIRYYRVVTNLVLRNDWIYEEQGVCDTTHLRFFTSNGAWRLCEDAGLTVRAAYAPLSRKGTVIARSCPPALTFLAAQLVFVAEASPRE